MTETKNCSEMNATQQNTSVFHFIVLYLNIFRHFKLKASDQTYSRRFKMKKIEFYIEFLHNWVYIFKYVYQYKCVFVNI